MKVIFDGDRLPDKEMLNLMEEAAKLCLSHEKVFSENVEISVTFVDCDEIRRINKEFRQKDKITDVLSFPQFDIIEDTEEEEIVLLGDVVICEEKAKEQALELGHSYMREIIYLFVHSVFHLLGHDHMDEDEQKKMREAEEWTMNQLGIERIRNL